MEGHPDFFQIATTSNMVHLCTCPSDISKRASLVYTRNGVRFIYITQEENYGVLGKAYN